MDDVGLVLTFIVINIMNILLGYTFISGIIFGDFIYEWIKLIFNMNVWIATPMTITIVLVLRIGVIKHNENETLTVHTKY